MQKIPGVCHNLKSVGKKTAAILVLASIFLVLLLSLNFRIWGGGYGEGSVEELVIEQEALLGDGLMLEESVHEQTFRDTHSKWKQLSTPVILSFFSMIFGIFFFPEVLFIPFFSEFLQCVTLCTLSVRMNR